MLEEATGANYGFWCFAVCVPGALWDLIQLSTWLFCPTERTKKGMVRPMSLRGSHPRLFVIYAILNLIMVAVVPLGFWFVFHPPVSSAAAQPQPTSFPKSPDQPTSAAPQTEKRALLAGDGHQKSNPTRRTSKPTARPSPPTAAPLGSAATSAPATAPVQQPTYQQKCEGSACAQGPGSQATYNQFGVRPREISDPDAFSSCLRAVRGTLIISAAMNDNESNIYAGQWKSIFDNAKWDTRGIDQLVSFDNETGQPSTGLEITIHGQIDANGKVSTDDPVAETMVRCLNQTGMPEKKNRIVLLLSQPQGTVSIHVGLDSRQ